MTDRLSMGAKRRLFLISGAIALASVGAAQTGPLHFYTLGNSQLTKAMGENVARQMNLAPMSDPNGQIPGEVYVNGGGITQGVLIGLLLPAVQKFGPATMAFNPDLTRIPTVAAPTLTDAAHAAVGFFSKNGFFNSSIGGLAQGYTAASNVWAKQDASVTGGQGKQMDVLRSIRFNYKADGLPIVGPSYVMGAYVDGNLNVEGFTCTVRPLVANTDVQPVLKSPSQLSRELAMDLRLETESDGIVPKVVSRQMVYFEQGVKWVQPAYLYEIMKTSSTGFQQPDYLVIPLAVNSPEPIAIHLDFPGFQPVLPDPQDGSPPPPSPLPSNDVPPLSLNNLSADIGNGAIGALTPVATTSRVQANPIYIGEYIVREDHPCWLNDANAFWGQLAFSNAAFWLPQKQRKDYWWDYRWLWEPDPGPPAIGDNSPWYVGTDHVVQIQGHGAPWVITCYKNYGEVIHLNQIAGYGTNQVPGERTAYVIWQSCDVIPQPGHPYEFDFTSPHSAFDVWWGIFKGMRGNYGYRTLMHICNGVGNLFGFRVGWGMTNVSSWLASTDLSIFAHAGGLDYGSCVIVSGHEGDCIYQNAQLPNPGSLTMWWIHA